MHRIGAAIAEFLGVMVLPLPNSPNVVDSMVEQEIKWCAPGSSFVKVNCDGAWDSGSNKAGIRVIIRARRMIRHLRGRKACGDGARAAMVRWR